MPIFVFGKIVAVAFNGMDVIAHGTSAMKLIRLFRGFFQAPLYAHILLSVKLLYSMCEATFDACQKVPEQKYSIGRVSSVFRCPTI